ncbi:hypothetical protein DFH06DRAFT_1305669 [Mycena polygramma]|nr:hypothetical protein DFH06DRAFT_1305669 [Mycena polygramma]
MSSATELRSRIAELSSAIDLQTQILRDLEITRASARRELNAICDPMARLPFELSSDIFTLCLPDIPQIERGTAPLVLLGICRLWSDIALSTPFLWATVHSDSPNAEHLEIWLSRAQNIPLELSLHASGSELGSVVKRHASQVQRLDLSIEFLPELHQMTTQFPALKKLKVMGRHYCENSFENCVAALRAAPALVEGDLVDVRDLDDAVPLTHPCLRHLRLGRYGRTIDEGDDHEGGAGILNFLTLPALETLFIGGLDISSNEFRSFLARSSPPLQSLLLGTTIDNDEDLDIRFLHSVPTLTSLGLDFWEHDIYDLPAMAILAFAQNFLPDLRHLAIRGWSRYLCQDKNLIPMLMARRTRLQSVEIISRDMNEPDDSSLAVLRKLVEDGMRIHVGTQRQNYIYRVGYIDSDDDYE